MSNILLIGFGSVAKNYLKAAKLLKKNVFYYDIAKRDTNQAVFFDIDRSLDSITSPEFESIVFCDYASTRTINYKKIKKLKTQRYIFEKLVSNSLEDIDFLRKEKHDLKKVEYRTHLRWNLLGLDRRIFNLQKKYDLGDICQMEVNAGNCCLSMGGAHWIGLFLKLFKNKSIAFWEVLSNIVLKYESPRREDIPVLSGQISLSLEEKSMFSLNFSSSSHVAPFTIFLFQYGRILMTFDGKLNVQVIEGPRDLSSHVYRLPTISKNEYQALDPDLNPFVMLLQDECSNSEFELGLQVSEIIVCSLINNKNSIKTIENIKNTKKNLGLNIT